MANLNKGTKEGTNEEIHFVRFLNRNKDGNEIWSILSSGLGLHDISHCYAVRVTAMQISKLTGKKVFTKADIYIASGNIPLSYLRKQQFFLDEKDTEQFNLDKLAYSGISIKRKGSARYQILKIPPDTFCKLFKNYELGAGASLYCMRPGELIKNDSVVKGWHTTWENMIEYFEKDFLEIALLCDRSVPSAKKIGISKQIKTYSTAIIKKTIMDDPKLLDFIFKGTGNFEEPYTATWLYEKEVFRKNEPYDFKITTGSGRSHGDFTIVVKP